MRTTHPRRDYLIGLAMLAWVVAGLAVDHDGWVASAVSIAWMLAGVGALVGARVPKVGDAALILLAGLGIAMLIWSLVTGIEDVRHGMAVGQSGIREAAFYVVDLYFIARGVRAPLVAYTPAPGGDDGRP